MNEKEYVCVSILQNPARSHFENQNTASQWHVPAESCCLLWSWQTPVGQGKHSVGVTETQCVGRFVLSCPTPLSPPCPSVCSVRNTELTFRVSVSHGTAKILEMAWCDVIWLLLYWYRQTATRAMCPVCISVGAESGARATSGRITRHIAQPDLLRNYILQAMFCSHHTNRGHTPPPHTPEMKNRNKSDKSSYESAGARLSQFDCLQTIHSARWDGDLYAWHPMGEPEESFP